jgi:RNA polymerase sigma-70 factor (ECF subfamily)
MQEESTHPILRLVRKIAAAGEVRHLTDRELLKRFATQRDEGAFEILVHRYGALVWRVCRAVLRESNAAEDAFQATFLVLVRKAGSIGKPELLGNWLYGVAFRVAQRARKIAACRAVRERASTEMAAVLWRQVGNVPPQDDMASPLQEELQRLPAKYRSPMVLCYLHGRSNEEAAQQLCWPVGTLKIRMMRARKILRTRLERRGVTLGAGGVVAVLASQAGAAAPASLSDTTIEAGLLFAAGKAAGMGVLSTTAVALSQGVLKTMLWTKIKLVAALSAAGLLGTIVGLFTLRTMAADPMVEKNPLALGPPLRAGEAEDGKKKTAEIERLQGVWVFATLEVEGMKMDKNLFKGSKIVVKGDQFTMVSMEATYKGTLKFDATKKPKTLDLIFTEGPEKGNTSLAIYELDGDTWKICLTIGAKERPKEFATKAGSGLGLETLVREAAGKDADAVKKELALFEGEWNMVRGENAGQLVPEPLLKSWKRVVKGNETAVYFGGQAMLKATFSLDISKKPKTIDYTLTDGPNKGKKQFGIYEIEGDTFRSCFAAPGKDRPSDFTTKAGDERTASVWKKAK